MYKILVWVDDKWVKFEMEKKTVWMRETSPKVLYWEVRFRIFYSHKNNLLRKKFSIYITCKLILLALFFFGMNYLREEGERRIHKKD